MRPDPPAVAGTILDPSGSGAVGVGVELLPLLPSFEAGIRRLRRRPDPEPAARTVSTEAGRFRLRAPDTGVFRVVVRGEGYLPVQYLPVVLVSAVELPPVVLEPGRETVVRVVDAAGGPAVGTWVFLQALGEVRASRGGLTPWRPDFRLGLTETEGRLVFSHAPGEELEATVFPPRAQPAKFPLPASGVLTVPQGAGRQRTLRVVDPRGEPVAGVLARVGEHSWPTALTAAEGYLRLPNSPEEGTAVRLLSADGRQEQLELAAGSGSSEPSEVVLPDAVLLRGRVLEVTGRQPLAGAVVWQSRDPGAFVRTDSRGRYVIVVPAGERFWFQAEAAGHVAHLARVSRSEFAAGQVSDLLLTPSVSIDGRVVDPHGAELAGVRLAAMPRGILGPRPFTLPDRADSRSLSTGDGKFTLDGLRPTEGYTLVASRPGWMTATARAFAPQLSDPTPRVEIVLAPDRPALGRVVDPQERPVPEARVELLAHGREGGAGAVPAATGEPDSCRAVTDARGRFRATSIPATELDVALRATGYAPRVFRRVQATPGPGPVDLGTFVLEPGAAITGRVLSPDEQPVGGAAVHAFEEELGRRATRIGVRALRLDHRRPEAETAADGTFAVKDLPAGIRKTLWIRAEGFLPAEAEGVEVPNERPLLVVLERARTVAGRVEDEDGAPVAGAHLEIYWQEFLPGTEQRLRVGARDSLSTVSDEHGEFRVSGVPEGSAALAVTAEAFVVPELLEIEVPADGIDDLVLVLERGAVVTGSVNDSDDEPVAGVQVVAGKASARTDAEGLYRIEGARPGPTRAWASHPHYGRFERDLEVEPGVNSLGWTFPTGREVSGQVLDGAGEPIPAAEVRLTLRDDGNPRSYGARSAVGGSFLFPTVAEGSYTLAAEAEGYAPSELAVPVGVAGEAVSDLEIVLERGITVHGLVLGLDFDEIARVQVEARNRERSHPGRVDYDGGYEITDLSAGTWLLSASLDAGRRQVEARVSLSPGNPSVVRDLEFGGGYVLSGRVLHDGEPLAGAAIAVRGHQTATERSVTTDHLGKFRFSELDRGEYWLGVSHVRELVTHNEVILLEADRELVIDLRPAAVRGTVAEAGSGRPLAEAIVTLECHGAGQGLIAGGSDGEGRVDLPRVPAGHYSVTVRKDGYALAKTELDVTAGQDVEELHLELKPTPALELRVRLASGQVPATVDVMVRTPEGGIFLAEPRPVTAGGTVRIPTVPAGRWEVLVSASGGGLSAVRAAVPGEPVPLVLPAAGRLHVRVSDLTTSPVIASLSLVGTDGQPLRAIDLAGRGFRDRWPLTADGAVVDVVPAGTWTLLVEAPDGRRWTQTVETSGTDAMVVLD